MRLAVTLAATLVVAWAAPAVAEDPVTLVNPLIGTSGDPVDGPSDTFPGADAPFGMLQWSPDTSSAPAGGGYLYNDNQITGFTLTHLSGPGCSVFGDVGILPTLGAVTDPAQAKQPFTHVTEVASPGYYSVVLGQPEILTRIAVDERFGLASFTFPASQAANILVNAASNQAGVGAAAARIVDDHQIAGSATSGWFCGMPGAYTVYFTLRFNRPFLSFGSWQGGDVRAGAGEATGSRAGVFVTFDTAQEHTVKVQAALSFVSIDGALTNLRSSATSWDLDGIRRSTAARWRRELNRIVVKGGTRVQRTIFYTALYHVMLHPNLFSDADGRYVGFDGRVHRADPGHQEYATFSGWDIYRTQIPLVALLEPARASDMMRSLVHAAQQSGWLPKWSLLNVESAVMGGDPADPMIAGAYAFGARNFDTKAALAAMVKGASVSSGAGGQGWYIERPELDEYLALGYVINDHTTNVAPVPNGASLTLEYALDDFSIAQFAKATGNRPVYAAMMARSQNWSSLFDRSSALITPRDRDGAFASAPTTENGQSGFQEGNAAQYSWMVPQDLRDLIEGMGGPSAAVAKLDTFFSELNAGQDKPFAWLGNEPTIGSPWVYLSAGAPWREQRVVRDAMLRLWGDTPDGLPGNDDLGTMSAWYVWCALGLYPQNPSVPILDLGAPLFPHVLIDSKGPHQISIDAPQAATANPFVWSVRVDGRPWPRSWIELSARPLHLHLVLGPAASVGWAALPADAPPSFSLSPPRFAPSTAVMVAFENPSVSLGAGQSAVLRAVLVNPTSAPASTVTWKVDAPSAFSVRPAGGSIDLAPGAVSSLSATLTAGPGTQAGLYDIWISGATADGALVPRAREVIRLRGHGTRRAWFATNFFDNSIVEIDPFTLSSGQPIPAGEFPRDLAVSPDGRRVYVSDNAGNTVSVIGTSSGSLLATLRVGNAPWGIRVSPDGKTVWVANNADNTVQPIETETLTVGSPVKVGLAPGDLAMSPDGSMLYVAGQDSNDVTPVDLRTRTALAPIPVGARPRGLALSPDGAVLYASNMGSNSVTPIDLHTRQPGATIPAGVAPRGLAVSPDNRWLYVVNFGTNDVTEVSLADRSMSRLPVGFNPSGVAFDRSGRFAVVANSGDNDCVVIDVRRQTVSAPIRIGTRPTAIAW